MKRVLSGFLALLCVAAVACAAETEFDRAQVAVAEGTPDASGLIRFLNDATTTYEVLDADIDRRAAANLIAARPFATVAQVDAVKYVGPQTLAALVELARARGFMTPHGEAGTYDGVAFTAEQAEAALRIVNEESDGVLSGEVGLASRAIRSIFDARPVVSMEHLAGLYWVGTQGLTRLRDYVSVFIPVPGERVDCRSNARCAADERCEGFANDGSTEYGKCRPVRDYEGYWRDCDDAAPCEAGLFCSGLTWGGGGWCAPEWMQDTFYNITQRFIPADGSTVTTDVVVYGQASVPMDIVVDMDLRHDRPQDLRIVLFDPNGADAVLWDGPNEGGRAFPSSFVAMGSISRDDNVNGRYLLRVTNVGGRGLGTLHSWQMWISSRFD